METLEALELRLKTVESTFNKLVELEFSDEKNSRVIG